MGNMGKVPCMYWEKCQRQGWKLQNNKAFPSEKCRKELHVRALFMHVLDKYAESNFHNFSLSFGKVSKFFSCPASYLPVPDRRTVCNFHPCAHVTCIGCGVYILCREITYLHGYTKEPSYSYVSAPNRGLLRKTNPPPFHLNHVFHVKHLSRYDSFQLQFIHLPPCHEKQLVAKLHIRNCKSKICTQNSPQKGMLTRNFSYSVVT